MIKLDGVTKRYRSGEIETTAVNSVSLKVDAGEYLAMVGPSGCGKSTLLGLIGMLDQPCSGTYFFEGKATSGRTESQLAELRRGRIGYVFQNFNLIDDLTVFDNVAMALQYGSTDKSDRRKRVGETLERLGLSHRANHKPSQLSGGQQQRVAIARALVYRPLLLLADEPTGNLDSSHGAEVMKMIEDVNSEGMTLIMVTHSPEYAKCARRVISLRDGAIISDSMDVSSTEVDANSVPTSN